MKKAFYLLFVMALASIIVCIKVFSPFATDHREEEVLLGAVPLLEGHADGLTTLVKVRGQWTPDELSRMRDPWGEVIRAELRNDVLILTSAGPDKTFGSRDDIKVERIIK